MSLCQRRVFFLVSLLVISNPALAEPLQPALTNEFLSDALMLRYDAVTGRVDATPPEGKPPFTGLQLLSLSGGFTGSCENLDGVLDVCSTDEIFKTDLAGFSHVDLGPILPAGLSGIQLVDDLRVDGEQIGGGFDVGSGVYLIAVPEPSAVVIVSALLLTLFSQRQRPQSPLLIP